MNILTSSAHFRQRVVKKSYKVGVTEASKYYRVCRQAIYEWRNKYDGKSWKSLINKSHRPHHHPNEHTPEEKEIILKRYPYYNGYAGNGKPIDAVEVYYNTPADVAKVHGYLKAKYRVAPIGKNYLSYQYDNEKSSKQDGYAGIIGKPFDLFDLKLGK